MDSLLVIDKFYIIGIKCIPQQLYYNYLNFIFFQFLIKPSIKISSFEKQYRVAVYLNRFIFCIVEYVFS